MPTEFERELDALLSDLAERVDALLQERGLSFAVTATLELRSPDGLPVYPNGPHADERVLH